MSRFEQQVAIVTGAGRGIGASIARRLADEGAAVALVDVNQQAATDEAAKIAADGAQARGYGCDVSDSAAVDALIDQVVADFGRLDILVNNAGLNRDNFVHKMTDEDWDVALDVNLKSAFLTSRAAQRHMVTARYGRIVNLSSAAARGNPGQANYAAAKAGVQGLTAALGMELGRFGIVVNSVAPGYVATEMTAESARRRGSNPQELERHYAEQTPTRRVAVPDDIASVVAFFASEDARFVNGQTLYVNGGKR